MKPANLILPIMCGVPMLFGCSSLSDKVTGLTPRNQVKPTVTASHSKQTVNDYYQIGQYYLGQNRLDKAEESLRKALSIHPEHIESRNALGSVYARQAKYDEAIKLFAAILNTNPNMAKVYNNLGYTYYLQGKYEESVRTFEMALKLERQNPRAWNNLGLSLHKMGKREQAHIAFNHASELSSPPSSVASINALHVRSTNDAKNATIARSEDAPKIVDLQSNAINVASLTHSATQATTASHQPHPSQINVVELAAGQKPITTLGTSVECMAKSIVSAPPFPSKYSLGQNSTANLPTTGEHKPAIPRSAITPTVSQSVGAQQAEKTFVTKPASVANITETMNYHLEIANGNGITGMAKKTGDVLVKEGAPKPRLSNIKPYHQAQTEIYYREGYREHALRLSMKLAIRPTLTLNNQMRKHTDVKLVLGKDIARITALTVPTLPSPLVLKNQFFHGFEA